MRYPVTKYHLLDDTTPTTESDMQATNKKYRISKSHHTFPTTRCTQCEKHATTTGLTKRTTECVIPDCCISSPYIDCCLAGHHNDCFLSSANDVGTYLNYSEEYPYLQEDTKYSIVGGEVCREDNSGEDR